MRSRLKNDDSGFVMGGVVQVWGAGEGYGNPYSELHFEVLNLKEQRHIATCKYKPGPI